MPYRNKERAKEYAREAMRCKRQGITKPTQDVIPTVFSVENVIPYTKEAQLWVKMSKKQALKPIIFEALKEKYDYRG